MPIDEVEPVFGPLIAVCRELKTHAGPVDIVFVNGAGLLTLVECKLWQNPEARRQVLAQILDYAKEISAWSYDQLESAIKSSSIRNTDSLYQLVASQGEELGQSEFIDSVSRNLKRGRFLLLVVGSGIRESVELLTDFLQRHAHLNFGLALVEVGIFKVPETAGSGYVVLPRVVAQTEEVVRAVIRIEHGGIISEAPPDPERKPGTRRKISEEAFYETLEKIDPRISSELRVFLDKAKEMGLAVEPGDNSLKLKFISDDGVELNLGIFRTSGTFLNRRIAALTERIGHPEIGETYLTRVAALIKGGYVAKPDNKWFGP